ncbi:MAG: hypothetical protein HY562_09595 [Ignavibacteriales bacterium]|nr:hypothetical protein [Ignavibacteriales bacterium]
MKHLIVILSLALIAFVSVSNAQKTRINGKAEDYHFAMLLDFSHAADHAQALYNQAVSSYEFNTTLAKESLEEIGKCLEIARTHHALVHKSYTAAEQENIGENHEAFLQCHLKANEAYEKLKCGNGKTQSGSWQGERTVNRDLSADQEGDRRA